jgi:hypothetical protein
MTETEWLACTEIEKLVPALAKLKPKPSVRKLRLYCVACCRRIWDRLDEGCRRAVEVAERYADGTATLEELTAAHTAGKRKNRSIPVHRLMTMDFAQLAAMQGTKSSWQAVDGAARPARPVVDKTVKAVLTNCAMYGGPLNIAQTGPDALSLVATLLHDVLGNPFRRPSIDPHWQTWNDGTVVKLAQAIYEERGFERLPILADALQDAGCTDAAILSHCRGPGPHARGCWVVDALLGKD